MHTKTHAKHNAKKISLLESKLLVQFFRIDKSL